ncbi:MAG: hypothetical protein ABI366_01815 [Ginsengibacter sp.]
MLTDQAQKIFERLQQGVIDQSLFTSDANSYFGALALQDFQFSLAPVVVPERIGQTRMKNTTISLSTVKDFNYI